MTIKAYSQKRKTEVAQATCIISLCHSGVLDAATIACFSGNCFLVFCPPRSAFCPVHTATVCARQLH